MPIMRGPVRARDLRANMKEYGSQEGIVMTLEQLLDEHVQDRENIRELAALLDRNNEILLQVTQAGGEMVKALEEFKRKQAMGDQIDHGDL